LAGKVLAEVWSGREAKRAGLQGSGAGDRPGVGQRVQHRGCASRVTLGGELAKLAHELATRPEWGNDRACGPPGE